MFFGEDNPIGGGKLVEQPAVIKPEPVTDFPSERRPKPSVGWIFGFGGLVAAIIAVTTSLVVSSAAEEIPAPSVESLQVQALKRKLASEQDQKFTWEQEARFLKLQVQALQSLTPLVETPITTDDAKPAPMEVAISKPVPVKAKAIESAGVPLSAIVERRKSTTNSCASVTADTPEREALARCPQRWR